VPAALHSEKYQITIKSVEDGTVLVEFPIATVQVIPPTGKILVTLPQETTDNDFMIICARLEAFFAPQAVGVIRAGDIAIRVLDAAPDW